MIWTIEQVTDLVPVMIPAGEPDQAVIDAYLRRTGKRPPPPKHQGVKRYYYLWQEDPRVRLCCVGMPLDSWSGMAMCKVGINEIIGEFPGNHHLVGRKGLQLQLNPIAWLKEREDQAFQTGAQALDVISFQVLDLDRAERSQEHIRRKYDWQSGR